MTYVGYEISDYLSPLMHAHSWVMPLPGWSLNDITLQCENDRYGR